MSLKILDLFCCAGGTSVGYGRAFPNAEIVGVDHQYQIRYPFRFIWDDALEFCRRYGMDFDLIHASPPCQFASAITPHQARSRHRNLIPATRNTILMTRPKAYVIENVENAKGHLIHPITLCGSELTHD